MFAHQYQVQEVSTGMILFDFLISDGFNEEVRHRKIFMNSNKINRLALKGDH